MFILRKISRQLAFNMFLLTLLVYFVYHTIYGDRGLISYFKLNQSLEQTRDIFENLTAERVEIEHQVKLLKSGDRDLLDEKARNVLAVASKNERVFSTTNKDNLINAKK